VSDSSSIQSSLAKTCKKIRQYIKNEIGTKMYVVFKLPYVPYAKIRLYVQK